MRETVRGGARPEHKSLVGMGRVGTEYRVLAGAGSMWSAVNADPEAMAMLLPCSTFPM